MGALSNQLYTMIVAMAVITTMAMPPTLRWVLARVPLREDEARRLEKEEAEEGASVPKMERALLYVDRSPNAVMAANVAGAFLVGQRVMTTVMEQAPEDENSPLTGLGSVLQTAQAIIGTAPLVAPDDQGNTAPPPLALDEFVSTKTATADDSLEKEASKAYSIVFAGVEHPISLTTHRFDNQLQGLFETFHGPVAIALNGRRFRGEPGRPLNILVPTSGASPARLATELAIALAKATGGKLTALHVFDPRDDVDMLRGRARRVGVSVLTDARRLGKRSGVRIQAMTARNSRPDNAIMAAATAQDYDLVVIGASLRQGETKFLGSRSAALVRAIKIPTLLIAQ
jgi:nucleotide-binding universal stress UspA family protein